MPVPFNRSISFLIPSAGKGPATRVTVVEQDGRLVFTVDVQDSATLTADLRGLFFHIDPNVLSGLTIVNADPLVTGSKIAKDAVMEVGSGNNMNGAVKTGFDVGVAFGEDGIGVGKSDINGPVSFSLQGSQPLSLDSLANLQVGVRLNSIGPPGGDRSGNSSKDLGTAPPAPHAGSDTYGIYEDGAAGLTSPSKTPAATQFTVLANDTDTAAVSLTVAAIGSGEYGPQHGSVTIAADGKSVSYTPTLDYAGSDSFYYEVSDGHGGTDFAKVDVNVTAVADIPTVSTEILPGATVNQTIVRVTAVQQDADISESIDRIELSGVPGDVKVTPGMLTAVPGHPGTYTQDFTLLMPMDETEKFDLGVTAIAKESSDSDEQASALKQVPIELDYKANSYDESFLATDQSIWKSGNAFTFEDNRFLGVDVAKADSNGGVVGYDYDVHLKAGFQSDLTFNGGNIDADMSYDFGVETEYNKSTDQLLVSSLNPVLTGATFTTEGPEGHYKLDLILDYGVDVALTYDIGIHSGNLIHLDFGNSFDKNILDLDSHDLSVTAPLPDPFGSVAVTLAWPNLTTASDPLAGDAVTSSGASNNFLQVDFDPMQALADAFLEGVNPLSPELNIDLGIGSVYLELTLMKLILSGGMNFLQDFKLQNQGLVPTLTLEDGSTQPFAWGSDLLISNASTHDLNHDGTVNFTLGLDPSATLANDTDLGFNFGYDFRALEISGGYSLFADIVDGDFHVGPAYEKSDTIPIASVNIYNDTFGIDFAAHNVNFQAG